MAEKRTTVVVPDFESINSADLCVADIYLGVGDNVYYDTNLFAIDNDVFTHPVEALTKGTITRLFVDVGQTVLPGDALAEILEKSLDRDFQLQPICLPCRKSHLAEFDIRFESITKLEGGNYRINGKCEICDREYIYPYNKVFTWGPID